MATEVIAVRRARKYNWPEAQLNFWLIIMLAASGTCLGVFASFMSIQQQLELGTPWLFPYMVTVSALAVLFIILILALIAQRQLLPGVVLLGSFMLFVLWLTGLIETSIQLYGPTGSVSGNCGTYVDGDMFSGVSIGTLAWLEQKNICNCWQAAFAFEVVGTIFFLWIMVMAYQVNRDDFD